MDEYLTILDESSGEYSEKRSKFIAAAIPCKTEDEVTLKLQEIKTKYWDARHNVYAYILKNGASRFSDDGEPHGTAGKPVLDVLKGSGLQDVLLVVTRYFGGVLLGTGGLVRAYSTSSKDALENAVKVKMCPATDFTTICDYPDHQLLLRVLENNNANIKDTQYAADVTVAYSLPQEKIDSFKAQLTEVFAARLNAIEGKSSYSPVILK